MYSLRLDRDLLEGMRSVKRRIGIPESEQIRRALRRWLGRYSRARKIAGEQKARSG